jgi:MFS family permease
MSNTSSTADDPMANGHEPVLPMQNDEGPQAGASVVTESEPPVPPSIATLADLQTLSDQTAAPPTWRVGTLAYTGAGLVTLFCWLLWGDFSWSMKERSVQPVIQFLLKRYGASDLLMSIFLMALPAALAIVLGPIVSYRSDRHRGRWGRRIPYLLWTTPCAVAAMVGLAYSPSIGHHIHNALGLAPQDEHRSILFCFGISWVIFDIATVIAQAVFGGLINDVVPRPLLGRFYGLFRSVSLIAGILFNYKILGLAKTNAAWIFLGIGALYGFGFMLMCFRVKEGQYPPPDSMEHSHRAGFFGAGRKYFTECFAQPYYLWVIAALVVTTICFNPINLFSQPYAISLKMSLDKYGHCIATTYTISLLAAYPLGVLADRFHPLRLGIITLFLYAVTTLLGGLYAQTPTSFAVAFIGHGVISGAFFTCTASLGQQLFPHSRYAQFASAAVLVTSIVTLILGPIIGQYLDWTKHAYRQTFYMGSGLTMLGVLLLLIVYTQFNQRGGARSYVAPE